jgi:hypothetical protein
VKELRPLVAKGVHAKWATNLLLAYYRHRSIDFLINVSEEESEEFSRPVSNCPLGEGVELSKFRRFSTTAQVAHELKAGKPFSVILFGRELKWMAGVVVVFHKCWFFRELVFSHGDSIDDPWGLTFHRVFLRSNEICLGYANGPVKTCLGRTGLPFWDYGTVLPDLINDTLNYRYGIVRSGWQYLDNGHEWNSLD